MYVIVGVFCATNNPEIVEQKFEIVRGLGVFVNNDLVLGHPKAKHSSIISKHGSQTREHRHTLSSHTHSCLRGTRPDRPYEAIVMAAFLRSVGRMGVSTARVLCGTASGGGMRVSAGDGFWCAAVVGVRREGGQRRMSGHPSVPSSVPRMTQLAWVKSSHHAPSDKDEDGESKHVVCVCCV